MSGEVITTKRINFARRLSDFVESAVKGIPEKIYVEDVRQGIYYTGVKLNTGHSGVAYTPAHEIPQSRCCPLAKGRMASAGNLLDLCLFEFVGLFHSEHLLERAVGLATINALSQLLWEDGRPGYRLNNDVDTLDLIQLGPQDLVGVVGAFPPVIKWARQYTKQVYVLEKNPKAQVDAELQPEEASEHILPRCQVVVLTGATIVNHTFQRLIELSRSAKEIVLLGPTASMIPEPFFDAGVTLMGGVAITNADQMLRVVSESGSGSHFYEQCGIKTTVTRDSRPLQPFGG